jgi:hypothetical protein
MPDIKTEMDKLLSEWNKPETTIMQTPAKVDKRVTNNVSRILFDYIKANPGKTINRVIQDLKLQGFKTASTTSLISQFCRKGLVRRDGFQLYAVMPEYVSMPDPTKKKVVYKPKPKFSAKNLPDVHTLLEQQRTRRVEFDPKQTIGTLSVYHAKALYEELKAMFGG